jgi:hypothetical protein
VGERRIVAALATGYWRWAFGDADSRALYDALWSGAASWLMEASAAVAAEGVRPEDRVIPRGRPLRWVVPADTDSVLVSLRGGPGAADGQTDGGRPDAKPAALDTVLVAVDGVAVQAPQPPGHYHYAVRAYGASPEPATGAGELTVERYSPEFTRPARALGQAAGEPGADRADAVAGARPGRPLRSMGWPYLALVALLCGEWVLRRRWGLR